MRWSSVCKALLLTILLTGCTSDGGHDTAGIDTSTDFVPEVGRNDHTMLVDDFERQYIVYASEAALQSEAAPLVVFFHGSNQTGALAYGLKADGSYTDQDAGWREVADAQGLIVAYPTALNYCFWEAGETKPAVAEKWTVFKLGHPEQLTLCSPEEIALFPENIRSKIDHGRLEDRLFVDAMLEAIQDDYPVDAKRMYLTGFSGGGSFATLMAQELSDTFAASHSNSAGLGDPPVKTSRGISHAFLLGTKDSGRCEALGVSEIPFENLFETYPFLWTENIVPILTMLDLTEDVEVDMFTVDGVNMKRWHFTTSQSGRDNSFQFILVDEMQHIYANGRNHDLKTAEFAWEFFSTFSLE